MEDVASGVDNLKIKSASVKSTKKSKKTNKSQNDDSDRFDPAKTIVPLFNRDAGLDDVKKIIQIYLSKGTIINNTLEKSTPDKKKIVNDLIRRYKLRDHPVNAETVTLNRVAIAFPIITISTLHNFTIRRFIPTENFLNTRITLPMELTNTIFLCTIPCEKLSKEDIVMLVAIVTVYAVKLTKYLKRKIYCKKSDKQIYDDIQIYLRKAMTSNVRDERENEDFARKLSNIYVVDGEDFTLTDGVAKIGNEAVKATKPFSLSKIYSNLISS